MTIAELREFAGFTPAEQRYIKRSLDIGLGRHDAFKLWARDAAENASIRSQYVSYQELKGLRGAAPSGTGFDDLEPFMGKLLRVSAFDLAQERLTSFPPTGSSTNGCSVRMCGRGCPPLSVRRLPCRKSAPTGARTCSNP